MAPKTSEEKEGANSSQTNLQQKSDFSKKDSEF